MKKLNLFWAMIFGMILVSCGGSSSEDELNDLLDDIEEPTSASVYVDNGADTTVNVVLTNLDNDEVVYEEAIESFELDYAGYIDYGNYHVTATTVTDSVVVDEDFEFEHQESTYSYNLNLTKEDYIVEIVTYVVNSSDYDENDYSFTYEGETYQGINAEVVKGGLMVAEDWDYNLDSEAPETVEVYGNSTTKRKLYRSSYYMLVLELGKLLGEF